MILKTGFFEEEPNVKSSTRLLSFLLLLFYFFFAGLYIFAKATVALSKGLTDPYSSLLDIPFIAITLIFLLGVFFPKYLHKLAELNAEKFLGLKAPENSTDARVKQ